MKSIYLAAIAAIFSLNASAAIVLQAELRTGGTVYLHDGAGPCPEGLLFAEYIARDGNGVPGCWAEVDDETIGIMFFDGRKLFGPKAAFSPPKQA